MRLGLKREHFRRAGWAFLATLFIVTGLGVGVYAFWVNIHNSNNNSANNALQNSLTCQFNLVEGQDVLPNPDVFKPQGQVSTLQTIDLSNGNGPPAKKGDCLIVKYYGTLAANGQFFDGNFDKSQALKFQLGGGQVIPGWDQGLVGMKTGGTRRIVVPAALGYGSQAQG